MFGVVVHPPAKAHRTIGPSPRPERVQEPYCLMEKSYRELSIHSDSCYFDTMTDQELETVALYVKDRLPELQTQAPAAIPNDYFRLAERIVRVEEGLLRVEEVIKNQNLLMEKRFEAVDKRFEAVDKRFEDLIHQIDKRFEDLIHQIDKRFETVDKRFEQMAKQSANQFGWTIGIMSTLILGLGALITIYRFFGSGG